jgi:hypothetical protein
MNTSPAAAQRRASLNKGKLALATNKLSHWRIKPHIPHIYRGDEIVALLVASGGP